MDTSREYIEMCSKAVEIQKNVKPIFEDGDFYVMEGRIKIRVFNNELHQLGYPKDIFKNENPIWLPRQDQLQEIVIDKYIDSGHEFPTYIMLEALYNHEGNLDVSSKDRSLEMAWLVFVMQEKFNKIWNEDEKDWVSNNY